jgi:hypothetical protein
MHRSRIGVVLIDHPASTYDSAATFWSDVVGVPPTAEADSPFATIGHLGGAVELALQRMEDDTPGRVHLDVESDDVDAEVARLTALGATVLDRREEHCILTDPGGLVFCVVPVQDREAFEQHARTWS